MAKAKAVARCEYSWGWVIVAIILITASLYSLAGGFITQFRDAALFGPNAGMAIGWYLVGVVLLALGKMAKCRVHCCCPAHGGR